MDFSAGGRSAAATSSLCSSIQLEANSATLRLAEWLDEQTALLAPGVLAAIRGLPVCLPAAPEGGRGAVRPGQLTESSAAVPREAEGCRAKRPRRPSSSGSMAWEARQRAVEGGLSRYFEAIDRVQL
eukprot:EG_transcript_31753